MIGSCLRTRLEVITKLILLYPPYLKLVKFKFGKSLEKVLNYALRVLLMKGVNLNTLVSYLVLPRLLLLGLIQTERRLDQVRIRVDVFFIKEPSDILLQIQDGPFRIDLSRVSFQIH